MWGWEPAGWAAQSPVSELGWVLGEEVGPGGSREAQGPGSAWGQVRLPGLHFPQWAHDTSRRPPTWGPGRQGHF